MITACIFDLDGVVVDTAKYHFLAWKRLTKELGFDFTEKDNERLKGVSRMDSINIILKIGDIELNEKDKLAYADKKNGWYKEFIAKMTPDEILPGVLSLFKELKKSGYKIALGSASKNAVSILKILNITEWFDIIIDGTKTVKTKPDPEVFLLAAKGLKTNPENCIVFEDAEAGVEAALNAGMYCIGIGTSDVLGKAHKVIPGLYEMNIEKMKLSV